MSKRITLIGMLAAVDVHYTSGLAVAGCVVFDEWTDGVAREERLHRRPAPAGYEPGLPTLLKRVDRLCRDASHGDRR